MLRQLRLQLQAEGVGGLRPVQAQARHALAGKVEKHGRKVVGGHARPLYRAGGMAALFAGFGLSLIVRLNDECGASLPLE
ncbi:hypothetical protein D3C81_1924980 [compost metagenome]